LIIFELSSSSSGSQSGLGWTCASSVGHRPQNAQVFLITGKSILNCRINPIHFRVPYKIAGIIFILLR
jgi:hypothetical protein